MMQTKFETKSKRVKGLSFHKYRPWILASLHNGSIHLFDYRAQVLLDKFEDHNGPVRGICFHDTQPMFVSGGDDHLIKVWNYKVKKCMFTLQGHLDYVRTVQFHSELPWIVSSSDDQTVRIWNWQNRSSLAILTGHSHYVMCAQFHPEDSLIASCSLDQTIRIWDFFKLKELSMQKQGSRPGELYTGSEVEVKHILEGHEKGVNWVSFHPSMKILASAADDKTIKLWRLSGNKHWEMDSLKGHTGNVSCVMFHPRMEILLSNSEDRTMRFWDMQRRVQIHQTRKDTDRYWIMNCHPTLNYFAAGYDNGMNVFKLERERHASFRVGSSVFYVKAKQLYLYDLTSKQKTVLAPVQTSGKQVLLNQPIHIYYNKFNQSGHDLLLNFDVENGQFLLMSFDKNLSQARCTMEKRGDSSKAAVFVARDKMCILDNNNELSIGSFDGQNKRKYPILKKGLSKIDMIFPAPLGKILVAADETLFLYDLSAKRVIHEMSVSDVKRVQWTPNDTHCVIITKSQIMIVDRNLKVINSQKESSKIKSGCFDELNSYVYSTSTHIKYMFLDGKTTGTFRSIDEPVYVAFFMKNSIFAVTRQGEMEIYAVDNTDYLFKIALHEKNLQEVKEILQRGKLCGRSIIAYLKEQGYSEIALFFEKDTKQRYNLALASGDIQKAFDAAQELKDPQLSQKLAQTAVTLGNYPITEKCYQTTASFDKLNFFYATTGSVDKLNKMAQVAQNPKVNDPMLRFNTSVLTANIEERVKTLIDAGQLPLAYMAARAHNLTDMVEYIETELTESEEYDETQIMDETAKYLAKSKALVPLRPINLQDGGSYFAQWPMTNLRAEEAKKAAAMFQSRKFLDEENANANFFDSSEFGTTTNRNVANILEKGGSEQQETKKAQEVDIEDAGEAWGDDDDEIEIDQPSPSAGAQAIGDTSEPPMEIESDIFVPPSPGPDPYSAILKKNPTNVALNAANGFFEKGLELLKNQIAVVNFGPLKQLFVDAYTVNRMKLKTLPHGPAWELKLKTSGMMPLLPVTVHSVEEGMTKGRNLTAKGEFQAALKQFQSCLQSVPLLAVQTNQEKNKVLQMVKESVEYILAMRIQLESKKLKADPTQKTRQLELECYMTLCGMAPAIKFLTYKVAFNSCYKANNFITAAHFARLVTDLQNQSFMKPDIVEKYKKHYQSCAQKGTNEEKLKFETDYSVQMSGVTGFLDAGSLTILEDTRSVATLKCPLCGAIYNKNQYLGEVCEVCQLCKLGEDVLGLNIQLDQIDTEQPTMQPSFQGGGVMTAMDGGSMASGNDLIL